MQIIARPPPDNQEGDKEMSARSEWNALTEQAQFRMCVGCIVEVARDKGGRVDPLEHVGGTWERINAKLDDADIALPLLAYKAAAAELQQAGRHERKATAAADFEVRGADGDALGSVLDTVAGVGSVENEAVTRVDFSRFFATLDTINQHIVNAMAAGMTQEEVAPSMCMSQSAVSKRLRKMRTALAVCME